MIMYKELLICFIPICLGPLCAPSGSSKIPELWHLKKTQFGVGRSDSCAEISIFDKFREEIFSIAAPVLASHFFYGQHFHLTAYAHMLA